MNLFKKFFSTDILDRIPHKLSDQCEHRKERMRELLELLPMQTLVKIGNIEDWKGTLTVTWRFKPTESQRNMIALMWRFIFCEAEENVEHEGQLPLAPRTEAQSRIYEERMITKWAHPKSQM